MKLAGCIITDGRGRILMLHRIEENKEQWEIPGGKLKPGEDTDQTARREVKEELGVDVETVRVIAQCVFNDPDYDMDYTLYLARIVSGKPKVMETNLFDENRYISTEDMHDLRLSSVARAFLALVDKGEAHIAP